MKFGVEKIHNRVKYSKFEHCVEPGLPLWGKWPIFWTKTNIGHAIGIVAYMSKKLELWPIDYAVFILFDDLELATTTLLSFLIDIKAMCMYDVLLFLQHKSCYEKKPRNFPGVFSHQTVILFNGNNTPGKFLVMHMNNQEILFNFPLCTIPLKQLQITIYSSTIHNVNAKCCERNLVCVSKITNHTGRER